MPELIDEQRALLAEYQAISARQLGTYADRWAAGQISLAEFERLFKAELKDAYIFAVWTANGQTSGSQADYGLAGRRLRDQYQFMHGFFGDIEAGKLTPDQIKARAGLYAKSSGQMLEQLGISEDDLPRLPYYPKDGSTQCKTNCNCTIGKQRVENGWDVTWELNPGETCEDCRRRASGSPLRVRFGKILNPEAWD